MPPTPPTPPTPPPLPALSALRTSLESFLASPIPFHILHTIIPPPPFPPTPAPAPAPTPAFSTPPPTLYILDSSFNPPTLAHFHIATSALEPSSGSDSTPLIRFNHHLSVQNGKRLLLLLATQNADKPPPSPSQLTQRLGMMTIFAEEIGAATKTIVDVGLIKKPYFHDKAPAIAQSGEYPPSTPHVYLIGFDTLIRLVNPKYYHPANNLSPLSALFSRATRLRVSKRVSEAPCAGDDAAAGQGAYVNTLAHRFESGGGKKEWAERIEFVDGMNNDEAEALSSTRVRDAVREEEWGDVKRMLTPRVAESVRKEGL